MQSVKNLTVLAMKYIYTLITVDSFLFGVLIDRNSTNNPKATKMQRKLYEIVYLLPTTKTILIRVFTCINSLLQPTTFIITIQTSIILFATLVHGFKK